MKIGAIRIYKYGPPSVLKWEEIEASDPEPNQVLVRHTAVGFNFADTYYRKGLYKVADFPATIGIEAAGIIEAAGKLVNNFKIGDRVVFGGGIGTYAEASVRNVDELVKVPRWMDDRVAAAALTKGCTVQYLFNQTHKLKKGGNNSISRRCGWCRFDCQSMGEIHRGKNDRHCQHTRKSAASTAQRL